MLLDMIAVGPPKGTVISQQPQKNANNLETKQEKPNDRQEVTKKPHENHENKQTHEVH